MDAKYKKYFDHHPGVDTFWFTTDGLAFANENKAKNHQKTLTGKTGDVKPVKREAKANPETTEKKAELEARLKNFQEVLLDTTDAKSKAEIEEKIKNLKGEIAKLK